MKECLEWNVSNGKWLFLAVIMRWVPPLVRQKRIKTTQEVCGNFLYTARAMDITTLHALNELCIAAIKGI